MTFLSRPCPRCKVETDTKSFGRLFQTGAGHWEQAAPGVLPQWIPDEEGERVCFACWDRAWDKNRHEAAKRCGV